MYTEVRLALILLALAMAVFPSWLAARIVSRNLAVASSWKRAQGVVFGLAQDDSVEIELRDQPDAGRIEVPVDHHVGLSFLKKVPIYVDPADARRVRTGGLFQMWLWPAGLILAAAILLTVAGTAAKIGHVPVGNASESAGRWMFNPPPPPMDTDIRVYRPKSEGWMPMVWSLLGVAALACGVFLRSGTSVQRTCLGAIGIVFMTLMWALALDGKTTEISADRTGIRKTTAFGWCQVPWDQLGSVEKQNAVFGRNRSMLRQGSTQAFPGRDVTLVVLADRRGRALIRMSESMQPARAVSKLFALCAERTGLRLEFRRIYDPNL